MLIAGDYVMNHGHDANELLPTVASVDESLGKVKAVLADTGYVHLDVFEQLEAGELNCLWPCRETRMKIASDMIIDRRGSVRRKAE